MCCKKKINAASVDCDRGRELGCQSFCCSLLVRLDPDEREPSTDGRPAKGFVPKDENGKCIHHDQENGLCRIWEKRPRVCREYECNSDPLMQVVMKFGFTSLGKLFKHARDNYIPKEQHMNIPAAGPEIAIYDPASQRLGQHRTDESNTQ